MNIFTCSPSVLGKLIRIRGKVRGNENCHTHLIAVPYIMKDKHPKKLPSSQADTDLLRNSVLYKEFLAEREEILRHKWLESEKAGQDIGFERALLDWIVKHRSTWRTRRTQDGAIDDKD